MSTFDIDALLGKYGEVHVTTDAGDEFELHKHDVDVKPGHDPDASGGMVHIDSREGAWSFPEAAVESVEVPDSEKLS